MAKVSITRARQERPREGERVNQTVNRDIPWRHPCSGHDDYCLPVPYKWGNPFGPFETSTIVGV